MPTNLASIVDAAINFYFILFQETAAPACKNILLNVNFWLSKHSAKLEFVNLTTSRESAMWHVRVPDILYCVLYLVPANGLNYYLNSVYLP